MSLRMLILYGNKKNHSIMIRMVSPSLHFPHMQISNVSLIRRWQWFLQLCLYCVMNQGFVNLHQPGSEPVLGETRSRQLST
jgi:hypothetical protein